MRIKLPFTEKFLWDFYKFTQKTGEALDELDSLIPPFGARRLLCPDIRSFEKDWNRRYGSDKNRKRFAQLVCKLRDGGYLKTLKVKGRSATIVTPKGIEKLFKTKLKMTEKKRRKDKKWQMVLFDIPEKERRHRDWFRKGLQYLGYKKLQKSIWVCPYDTLEETENLIKRYKLEPHVELLLVKKIGLG